MISFSFQKIRLKSIKLWLSCWHILIILGFRTEKAEHEISILMQVDDDRFEIISIGNCHVE